MRSLPLASASWQFRDATKETAWPAAVVPGCVHTDLRRHGLIPDPFWGPNELELQWTEESDREYRASFNVPAAARRPWENSATRSCFTPWSTPITPPATSDTVSPPAP